MESSPLFNSTGSGSIESKTSANLTSNLAASPFGNSPTLTVPPSSHSNGNIKSAITFSNNHREYNHREYNQEREAAVSSSTIATAISFATPENSPFLTKHSSSCGVNMSTGTNIVNATKDIHGLNTTATTTSTSNSNNNRTTTSTDIMMVSSVTPQAVSINSTNIQLDKGINDTVGNNLNYNESPHNVTTTTTSSKVTPASSDRKYKATVPVNNAVLGASAKEPVVSVAVPSTAQVATTTDSSPITSSSATTGSPSHHFATRIPSLQPRKLPEQLSSATTPNSTTGSDFQTPSLCSSQNSNEEVGNGVEGGRPQNADDPVGGDCATTRASSDHEQQSLTRTVSESLEQQHKNHVATSIMNNNNDIDIKDEKKSQQVEQKDHQVPKQRAHNFNNTNSNRNTMRSPIPPPSQSLSHTTNINKTPINTSKSKNAYDVRLQQQHSDFPSFGSPGLFLSPYLPSPPNSRRGGIPTGNGGINNNNTKNGETPTNFARDFGKTDFTESFDTSALPWLSPSANHFLFSPNLGISSVTNTPGGGIFSILRSPQTPNGVTSKLALPLTGDVIMSDTKKSSIVGSVESSDPNSTGANASTINGISSMICVSPLASRKSSNFTSSTPSNAKMTHATLGDRIVEGGSQQLHNGANIKSNNSNINSALELFQPDTPINFKEVFASPTTDSQTGLAGTDQSNEIPELGSSMSLDKHITERDVREDEDLNVLLKLAENTPNRKAIEPKLPSRSFRNQLAYTNHPRAGLYTQGYGGREPPPSLHLPYIGKNGQTSMAQSKQNPRNDDFTPPSLSIRPNSSSSPNTGSTNEGCDKRGNVALKGQHPPSSRTNPPVYLPAHPGAPKHVLHPPPSAYSHPPPHFIRSHPPYYSYQVASHPNPGTGHPPPPYAISLSAPTSETSTKSPDIRMGTKTRKDISPKAVGIKRLSSSSPPNSDKKKLKKKGSRRGGKRQISSISQPLSEKEREKSAATITAINASAGSKNDKAASLASAILRGVTMRPSGKWQAQLYYAGKSRYIGVFDTREKAALAYEIAREKLKADKTSEQSGLSLKETEANVNAARKAAFEGVNEKDPRNEK